MYTISEVNIDQIAGKNAEWYLFLLEDNLTDPFRKELYDNVGYLAENIGPNNWIGRGHEHKKDEFASAIFHRYKLYLSDDFPTFDRFLRPAILVTNAVPPAEGLADEEFKKIIRITFYLSQKYKTPGSISDFLTNLSLTVKNPDALETLKSFNEKKFMETWGRIIDCVEIKFSILGIASININKIIKLACQGK